MRRFFKSRDQTIWDSDFYIFDDDPSVPSVWLQLEDPIKGRKFDLYGFEQLLKEGFEEFGPSKLLKLLWG